MCTPATTLPTDTTAPAVCHAAVAGCSRPDCKQLMTPKVKHQVNKNISCNYHERFV